MWTSASTSSWMVWPLAYRSDPDAGSLIPHPAPPSDIGRSNLAHWAELVLSVAGIFRGILGIVTEWTPLITQPVDRIPPLYGTLVSVSLIAGGAIWVCGIIRRFKTLNRYYYVLRTGLMLSAFGWLSFFTPAVIFKPAEVSTWAATLTAAIAVCGLYLLTFINERTIRQGETKA